MVMLDKLKKKMPILSDEIELNVFGSDGTNNEIILVYKCKFRRYIEGERKLTVSGYSRVCLIKIKKYKYTL